MVVNKKVENCETVVKWVGASHVEEPPVHLEHKKVAFYRKCIIGPLSLSVDDFVLVSNADAAEPDTVNGCDIARILYLYELREMSRDDPCRAVVQWYSRPQSIPHKVFDADDIAVDFDTEIIEDYRSFHPDISLETIFRKCQVLSGTPEVPAQDLLSKTNNNNNTGPMFVCRYKFIKEKKRYRLVPLQFSADPLHDATELGVGRRRKRVQSYSEDVLSGVALPKAVKSASAKKASERTPLRENRKRASMAAINPVEFLDVNDLANENKVSPIKIIGGRSVVRLSAKKPSDLCASPLAAERLTPISRARAARRNLNLSLENGANTTTESDCANYSIVREDPSVATPSTDIKIKLRLSERRRSTRLASVDQDPLELMGEPKEKRKASVTEPEAATSTPNPDIYRTPTKALGTLSTRRKSILKSASTRLAAAEGTPKRSIQLSNIVEKRVFQDDEIISTPKRGRAKATVEAEPAEPPVQKTPTRKRRSSVKASAEAPESAQKAPMTPSQKLKMIRSGELSPTMNKRQLAADSEQKSSLNLAREQLHVSVVPTSLPCREKEFSNIYTFLEGKIQDQCGGCIYVSGVPGTGKTATVTAVIRSLQQQVAADELPPFEFLEINGMRLTEPRQAYVHIYRQLTGKTVSWEHAHMLLEKRFTTPAPRRTTTVLLVDELDILCNRRQDVVYNLLDWPTKSAARLVVITIANTMDLPERLLMGKVTSRLGLTRLTFQPYSHKQLQEIVVGRLQGSEAFKSDAIQLVARKVAAVSGDARRALDICRRATEIADEMFGKNKTPSKDQHVNMLHVQQALSEMIASAKVQAIKKCSKMEQVFLQAVAAEVTRTGVEETTFMGVYHQMETIAAFTGATVPNPGRALRICAKLGAERLLICEHSRTDIFQKILLNVSSDDIHYALRVDT